MAISDGVHEHVHGRVGIDFVDSGNHEVKNIERPVHIWSWSPNGRRRPTASAAPERRRRCRSKPSIAVLPFDNMSGDPEQGYFADGITEDIITDLSKVSGLFVIARNSSFAYKGQAPDIRKVSRELGVRYVLEGSVRRAADRVRINAQMIDGTTGGHLWAERYDRDLEDIFAVQDEVTRTIVDALKVKLTAGEEARRESRGKVDPEAYDLLVRARQTVLQLRPEAADGSAPDAGARDRDRPGSGARLCAARRSSPSPNTPTSGTARRDDNLTRALELARKAIDTDDDRAAGLSSRLRWRCPGCGASTRRKRPRSGPSRSHPTWPTPRPALATSATSRAGTKTPSRSIRGPTGSTRNSTCPCISSDGPCSRLVGSTRRRRPSSGG